MTTAAKPDHAIVIGASMAGLLAARVLSDHFSKVTIIDRDRLPSGAQNRRGVPQGLHTHVLLERGEEILNAIFPGISLELEQAGAPRLDGPRDTIWFHEGGYKARFDSDITYLGISRPLLESRMLRRVRDLRNVTFIEEHEVVHLVESEDRQGIAGVVLRPRGSQAEGDELRADLVVDASGRGSRTPRWLQEAGYRRPRESVVKVGIGYTTRVYRRDPNLLPDAEAIYVMPQPPLNKRGGILFRIEGDRWMVTLAGWLGDHAPTSDDGFLEFSRSLASDDIYRVIARAEPLTEPLVHGFPATVRHHYEGLSRFPQRFLVIGDAICSFNPVYGQGMSVAALEAQELEAVLREGLDRVGPRFFKRAAKVIANPWLLAVGADFQFDGVQGPKPPMVGAINAYLARLHRLAHHDKRASQTFIEVVMLTRPPTAMFAPSLVWAVARNSLPRLRGRAGWGLPRLRGKVGWGP